MSQEPKETLKCFNTIVEGFADKVSLGPIAWEPNNRTGTVNCRIMQTDVLITVMVASDSKPDPRERGSA